MLGLATPGHCPEELKFCGGALSLRAEGLDKVLLKTLKLISHPNL